jgi:hypothetical protein
MSGRGGMWHEENEMEPVTPVTIFTRNETQESQLGKESIRSKQ